MNETKKAYSFTTIIKYCFYFYLAFNAVSYLRKEFFPSRHPELNEINPYYSDHAVFDLEIWLMKGAKKERQLFEKRDVQYDFDPSLPVSVSLGLSDQIKANLGLYKVRAFLTIKEKNKQTQTKSAESPLLFTKNREIRHRSNQKHSDLEKLTITSKKGSFQYFTTKLYFQVVNDQKFHYFEKDPFAQFLYRQHLVQLGTGDIMYTPILNGNQWWLLNRYLLPLDQLHSSFAEGETFPGSDDQKQNKQIEILFWVTSFTKHSWTEHLRVSEERNLFPELSVFDEFKALLVDNTPTYLCVLFSVNFLHTLFSFLSLQQNFVFYRNLSDNTGLSVSQAYSDVVFEFVGILYLMDNDTSLLIIGISMIEFVFKVWVAFRMSPFRFSLAGGFPFVKRLESTQREEYTKTKDSESQVIRFLLKLFVPVYVVYFAYSLFTFETSKGVYSFALEKTVGFIYIVGFANMFPQIYINYTLKSVEFMPWKALIYKFFNTIIDDLFAFAVKMPTLKRLSVFRDDIVFVIFLGQWWVYRKNKKRGTDLYNDQSAALNQDLAKTEEKTGDTGNHQKLKSK